MPEWITKISISDWAMLLAVLLAPVLAVQVQRWIEDYRQKSERKAWIFKTLMATRAEGVTRDHVKALNLIELEYYNDKKGRRIVEKWKEYLDHLGDFPASGNEEDAKRWSARRDDLFTDLLYEMAVRLGYQFDKVVLRKGVYAPQAFSDQEIEERAIRKGVAQLLYGHSSLPVVLVNEQFLQQVKLQAPEAQAETKPALTSKDAPN
jgi:hypothetical protein